MACNLYWTVPGGYIIHVALTYRMGRRERGGLSKVGGVYQTVFLGNVFWERIQT